MIGTLLLDDLPAVDTDLLGDQSGTISGRRERETKDGVVVACGDTTRTAPLPEPELAATWRQVVQP